MGHDAEPALDQGEILLIAANSVDARRLSSKVRTICAALSGAATSELSVSVLIQVALARAGSWARLPDRLLRRLP